MHDEHHSGYLAIFKVNRAQALQLFGAAVVLGLGVNLLASALSKELAPGLMAGISAGLVLVALVFLSVRALWPGQRVQRLRGFVIYDSEANSLINPDDRYRLGRSLRRYLEAAFAENKGMKLVWTHNPVSRAEHESADSEKSLELIRQAAEYFVLRDFSTGLTDYFRAGDYAEDELETLSHTDIPDVLLQNKFMKIFAEPMEERSVFLDEGNPVTVGANIVSVNIENGALYERFQLVLPKKWRVNRSDLRCIDILTPRFRLAIHTSCRGISASLPPNYLGSFYPHESSDRYMALDVGVEIKITPRRAWLVTPRSWKYYRWIDEWMARLEENISTDSYLEATGWRTAETIRLLNDRATNSSDSLIETAPDDDLAFRIGDRVEHNSFGAGEVVGREPGGVALITFDDDPEAHKPRKLMWDFAPIRIVERGRPLD
jgi:hypothetical protein